MRARQQLLGHWITRLSSDVDDDARDVVLTIIGAAASTPSCASGSHEQVNMLPQRRKRSGGHTAWPAAGLTKYAGRQSHGPATAKEDLDGAPGRFHSDACVKSTPIDPGKRMANGLTMTEAAKVLGVTTT